MKAHPPQPADDSANPVEALAADGRFVLRVASDTTVLSDAAWLAADGLAVGVALPPTAIPAAGGIEAMALPSGIALSSAVPVQPAAIPLPALNPVAMPVISVADIVVGEGDGFVDLVVRLSAPGINTVTVAYRTSDGSADDYGNGDYSYTNGTLTFATGEIEKTVRVALTNDLSAEALEHFYFTLSGPTNSSLGQATSNITVIDNDTVVGTPQLFVHDVVIDEKAGTATFAVTLGATGGQSSGDAVSVNYATANRTASAGSDYTASSGTLTFAPGESVKTVVVNITDDSAAEAFERFGLNLSGASGASIVDGNALATIGANDATAVALPRISVSDIVVGEDDGWVDVVISLSAPGQNVVTVNYDTVDGLADDYYRDYFNAAGTLKFAIGETTKVVRVFLTDDTTAEALEHFYFTLNTPANATIGQALSMVTVADNEAVAVNPGVHVRDVVVDEKAGTASFVVMLGLNGGQSSSDQVTVDYTTASGTATSGSDFIAQSGTLTFAAGESVKTVVVDISDDTTAEALERFGLNLSNATGGAVIVDGSAVGEIGKNDATAVAQPRISVSDIVVGEDDGYVDIVVSLSAPGQNNVTVNFSTSDGTADNYGSQDYYGGSGSLTFVAGETSKVVRVQIVDNGVAEVLEHFRFNLNSPVNATIAQASAMITTVDNDSVVDSASLHVRDVVVDERAGTATFVVWLGQGGGQSSNETVTVNYATASGTATSGSDFVAASGSLKFAPGESVKTVVVDINDDGGAEGNERFGLTLSSAVNAVIVDGAGTVVIGANDASTAMTPLISASEMTVAERDGFVDVVVRLSAPSASSVAVNYSTSDGTAQSYYRDYVGASGVLNFAAGETTKVVRIELTDDGGTESLEAFRLNLSSPVGAALGNSFSTVSIVDDDTVDINVFSFGIGDDIYTINAASDIIVESFDGGVDLARASVTYTLNAEVENLLLTGSSALNGTGNASHNLITGNSAANTLTGLSGNDTLDGASGSDALIGGTGNDTYLLSGSGDAITEFDGQGTDSVLAGFSHTLGTYLEKLTLTGSGAINGTGNSMANTITGNSGANLLVGGSGNDTLNGGAGNDSLDGGIGNDSLIGGTGNDSYTVDSGTDVISETTTVVSEIDIVTASASFTLGSNLEKLSLTGSTAMNGTGNTLANTITGNSGANLLVGGSGNDTLSGGSGNDSLDGGTGDDSLTGGSGNDSYTVDSVTDLISETTTVVSEIDSVTASLAWTLGSYLEKLTLTGSTAINGTGNTLANTITGNTGNNSLSGSGGSDTLIGGGGNDTLNGGSGNDSYTVDSSTDVISETTTTITEIDSVSSSVAWTLGNYLEKLTLTGSTAINGTGNTLANTVTGNSGANLLAGGSGNDTLSGGAGNDSLDGGAGNDSLVGGSGNDRYTVDNGSDVISETTTVVTEIDSVTSSVAWTLGNYLEKLTLTGSGTINGTGNTLANTITGNTGNNSLNGSGGHDTLIGGGGNDTLVGGSGNDSYTVDSGTDLISETTTTTTEIDSVSSSVTWTLGSYLEKLTLTGSTAINGTGNTLANTVTGNSGNNLLDGGSGSDTLNGGAGLDTYRFSSALNSASNVDTVSGFVTVDDSLQLENGVFLKLTATGVLNASFFRASTTGTAADSNDFINYETDTGKLFYDADGSGAGAAVLFATLTGTPTLSSADIFVT